MSGLEHTAAGAIEVVAGSKMLGWAGNKLLGPVFDEIGREIKDRYSDRRLSNFTRIGRNAEAKAGPALDQPGEVNPRVAMKILDEGSLCDGPVMAEYFGGIMAGARSPDGSDDRGLAWAGLVSRLSTDDIHLHYLFYDAFRQLYLNRMDLNVGVSQVRDGMRVYFRASRVLEAMGLPVTSEHFVRHVVAALHALSREDLIGPMYLFGSQQHLVDQAKIDAPDAGGVVVPSMAGIELFMWAFNHGDKAFDQFLSPELPFVSQEGLSSVTGSGIVDDMVRERREQLDREKAQPLP